MSRVVHVHNAHPRLKLDRRAVIKVVRTLDAGAPELTADAPTTKATPGHETHASGSNGHGGVPAGELSLAFLTDAALARIHADFLDDPSTTDVITFEGNASLASAGEICVSADTAATFAQANERDFSEELTLYIVHGWLHLAGYDDLKPEKKRRMRAAEKRAMTLLRAKKALPKFLLQPRR
jgi:probable rRNA maturation factor